MLKNPLIFTMLSSVRLASITSARLAMAVGFAAASPEEVDAFHAAGLAAGGKDEGQPGPRSHLPGAYAAYLRDPAGNKITAYTFI